MEKLFEEILLIQNKKTILHNEGLLIPKITYFIVNLISIAYPNILYIAALVVLNSILLTAVGSTRLLAYSLILWSLTTLSVSFIPLLTGVYSLILLKRSLHALACFLSLTILFSTTPPRVLSTKPLLNKIVLPYVMFRYTVREVKDITLALKAKGWDPRFNPIKYIAMLINILLITTVRIDTAVESIKSRGLD